MQYIRVLIVEDHSALANNLAEFFDDTHYQLDFASDGLTALHLMSTHDYDVIVMDVMLPGISGVELCKRLRRDLGKSTPLIFMTAKDQLIDKEEGFAAGADDYLVKPFHLRELQLRIDALSKRVQKIAFGETHSIAGFLFDVDTGMVKHEDGGSTILIGLAADIFKELLSYYPKMISYEQLVDNVWNEKEVDMNTIRTHVYGLRKQLQEAFGYGVIKTYHGKGYRLLGKGEVQGS
ncbi:response regulator transcription factor [Pelistega sp. MC2]|uniref:response regulator transcription factor n=1 Tax=Pelistega sp. MC2 TaxID=1720297 RepID=UPI0008DA021C|nr:response regulator transcription factor [Pelistega sp. MC2]